MADCLNEPPNFICATVSEEVELIFEKKITPFGNSAKIDAPKKYRGWRAYVIIVKE